MSYSLHRPQTPQEVYDSFCKEEPDWIILGLDTVNEWGRQGSRGVQLQMAIGIALKQAYERGLKGLPPRDIPIPPQIIRRSKPPAEEVYTPTPTMVRRAPKPIKPAMVRRSR